MADNPMTLVSLESVNNLVREHLEHGEFVHGGRYECADAILAELGQLAALKQPRTQWQPRITPDEAQELFCAVLCESLSDSDMFIARLRELGIDVIEPPEASREARMAADGITEEDLAETMPPKPEDAR